ncbi:MAG: MFS transporter [Vulcanisaeta sp.]|uniref:MFS transporter n=1 Tax=Vulcanisaeta sp. TaxID=2020871 RepID=UPI003D0E6D9B
MFNSLHDLFSRYRGVLGVRDIALLVYSNAFVYAVRGIVLFVPFILGFDTMRIFGVALVYVTLALSSVMRLFSGALIDILGRERRALIMGSALIASLFMAAFLVLAVIGTNSLGLVIVLIIVMTALGMFSAINVVKNVLVKELLSNDDEKITLYTSLNNTLISIVSLLSTVVSGYLLYLSIGIAKYLFLVSALLSIASIIPLILIKHEGRVVDKPNVQAVKKGLARFSELFRSNDGFRAVIVIMVVTYLIIVSLDVFWYSILSMYYNVALLAGIGSVFDYIGAAIGSILTPKFSVNRLGIVNTFMVMALIIGLGFGVIPITIRGMAIAVPILFALSLAYNLFNTMFFTGMQSAFIYVAPREEFGIVYSSMFIVFTAVQVLSAIVWAFIGTAIGAPEALLLAMITGVIVFSMLNAVYGKVSLKV